PEPPTTDAADRAGAGGWSVAAELGARAGRWALAAVAIAIVVWSFVWVMSRPLRQAKQAAGRVEITVLHWGDRDEDGIVQSLVESFERANPDIRIKRINAGANYAAKLQTMIASGDPPDVFFLNDYHLPIYAPLGILMDVEPFLARDGG